MHWQRRVHHQYVRNLRQQRDRREILQWIIGEFAVQAGIDSMHSRCRQQHVAIAGSADHRLRADIAACTRAIFDDDLLLPDLGQLLPDDARQDVGRAAGRLGHDDAYGFSRISLGTRLLRRIGDRREIVGGGRLFRES